MHLEMENKEPSSVKLINRRCLETKPYNCLISGKQARKKISEVLYDNTYQHL